MSGGNDKAQSIHAAIAITTRERSFPSAIARPTISSDRPNL
jgi:hypothetical protein